MKFLSNLFFADIDFCRPNVIQGLDLNFNLYLYLYKFLNGFSPDVMNFHAFATDVPRNNCMLNSVVHRANKLPETLPSDLKSSCSLELLKKGFIECY